MSTVVRVCFVCLGNICRSPTAEGVMKKLVQDAGIAEHFFIDSAGTGASHVGEQADPRSRAEAQRRGVTLTSRARRFTQEDFSAFDYIIAMDRMNQRDILRLAQTPHERAKVALLRSFEEAARSLDVPDPYMGGARGFAEVFDLCERGCAALLAHVRNGYSV